MSVQEDTEKAVAMAKRALQRCNELEDDNEALRAENRELRDELDRVKQRLADIEERDSLADAVIDASRLKVEERAAICIKTIANEAVRRKKRGEPPLAEMDYNAANDATGRTLDRRQLLDALERAATLVDSDVLRFKSEPRAAQKNSRLIINLDAGDLPTTVAGMDVTPEAR